MSRRRLGRVRRAMRPRGPQPRAGRILIALQAVAALVFAGYLVVSDRGNSPFAAEVTLRAEFADAAGLRTENHSPVTVAGVPSGRVEAVDFEDGVAVATLSVDADAAEQLGRGSTASVVSTSALQALTVDIDPGGGPRLGDGATIPPARTSSTIGADRVVGILDADTRAQIQVLLPELAAGLKGRAPQLREDLAALGQVVDSSSGVAAALADRRAALADFVDGLDAIATTLAERREQLGDAVDVADRTLTVTAARDRELGDTLRDLPGVLASTNEALESVGALERPLAPALDELRPVAERLPGALGALRDLLPGAGDLVDRVDRLAAEGAEPVGHLRDVLAQLRSATEAVDGSAADLAPIVRAVDRNKEGIGVLGDRFSGVFSTNDSNGPILRGLGFFEPFDPEDVGFPAAASEAARADAVAALKRVCLRQNQVACLARYLIPGLPGFVGAEDEG